MAVTVFSGVFPVSLGREERCTTHIRRRSVKDVSFFLTLLVLFINFLFSTLLAFFALPRGYLALAHSLSSRLKPEMQ